MGIPVPNALLIRKDRTSEGYPPLVTPIKHWRTLFGGASTSQLKVVVAIIYTASLSISQLGMYISNVRTSSNIKHP
jgi:hypothetical protein